ncbi:hypothetical protein KDA_47990 [Dictyobacter alpinus]|uniref:Protein-tyrosine-phosphatase n=1 Tax=Dictyobacter alpinus TaxID=2014873 RepID=A0A402BD80_9CHLR|nr:tyrosine-protein phosphatase [Dictyobacter alpinus]GCE29315.1 hypothetical protein KDA_47990 [Dictyobacter alpinus]
MEQSINNKDELYQRRLTWEGCYNARDIGGYATLDGHTTRWKTVLRADSPNELTSAGQRLLLAYPVRTIIDLRRTTELRRAPSIFVDGRGVRYLNISLLEDERKAREAQSLQRLYSLTLETCQEPIKQVLQFMATEDIFPCIVHCTIGKDRTGLMIALLLSIANVPMDTIATDYALSEQYLVPLLTAMRARLAEEGQDVSRFEWLMPAHAETMYATLTYLAQRYGSVKDYLLHIGLTQAQLDRLHTILVE